MILQTGGRALGATSTRARPRPRARRRHSAGGVGAVLLSSWSIRNTGEILICSLWRKLVEMAGHSCVETAAMPGGRARARKHRRRLNAGHRVPLDPSDVREVAASPAPAADKM